MKEGRQKNPNDITAFYGIQNQAKLSYGVEIEEELSLEGDWKGLNWGGSGRFVMFYFSA